MLLRLLLFFSLLLMVDALWAQSRQDSLTHHYDSLARAKQAQLDKAGNKTNHKIDSVQAGINNLLNPNFKSLNNKRKAKKQQKDSIAFEQGLTLKKQQLQMRIDSLKAIDKPTHVPQRQLDSLNKVTYQPLQRKAKLNTINEASLKRELEQKKIRHDSIQFYQKIAKEKGRIQKQIEKAAKEQQPTAQYTHQLDSLDQLKFTPHNITAKQELAKTTSLINDPTAQLNSKIDSVSGKLSTNQYTSQIESKANAIENKVNAPVDKVENAVNDKLSLMNKEGGAGANVPGYASLPNAQLPDSSLPNTSLPDTNLSASGIDNPLKDEMGEAGELKTKLNDAKSIPSEQINKLKSVDEIKDAQGKLSQANAITDKAQGYSKDVSNIAKGDLSEVKELPKAAEDQVKKMDEVQGLQKETAQFDQYKQMADKAKDPAALKEEALRQAPKMAVNHFAGKEAALQSAMDQMSKLKTKYESLNSLKDLPKRSRNTMRGKPFIERLLPGINLQFQRSGDFLLDYNPYAGYRFYGRFMAGAGWNERVGIEKHVHLSLKQRIYGPRVYADFMLGKGFSVRTDIEKMNTFVPSLTNSGYSTTDGYRAWVWSAFVGIRKEYKFMKNVKGTAQFLYNLYDDHNNSPYADRIMVRMGFEFQLKKKQRSNNSQSK